MHPNQLLRNRPPLATALLHAAFLMLALALGSGAANLASGGSVALWWPAAGCSALAVLAVPRDKAWIGALNVSVVMTIANLLADRAFWISAGHGVANGVEALVVVLILTRGRRNAGLVTMNDLVRLMVAACVAAAAGATLSGLTLLRVTGEVPLRAIASVVTSHASAILIMLPVVIGGNHPAGPRSWKHPTQGFALLAVVATVFWPGSHLPLTFLPMPFLVWATFLYSTRHVAAQLLIVAGAVTILTGMGGGPFAVSAGPQAPGLPVSVMQVFLLTYGASILTFAVLQEERRHLRDRLVEREQMLHGGIVDAQFGMIIMNELAPDVVQVVQSNRLAARLLAPDVPFVPRDVVADEDGGAELPLLPVRPERSALLRAIEAVRSSPRGEIYDELDGAGGKHVELHLTRVPRGDGEAILTAQLLDVTQQRRADAALLRALEDERAAAEHLRDLSQQQDDFVSTVSHELRTPITSILGFTELLVDDTETTEEQRRHLAVVERNAHRLRDLVEDLLAVGAGAQGRNVSTRTDLRSLCADVVEELTPFAKSRGVTLRLLDGDEVAVTLSAADISRVVTNLVTNAVKFTPSGGLVAVQVTENRDGVLLTVTDTGVGIKRDDLDRVFNRFYRSATATAGKVPGAGLGLTLVRSLVDRNGGTVELTSNGTSGTQATVRLPAVQPDPAPVPAAEPARAPDVP